jgi:hypothetical protein
MHYVTVSPPALLGAHNGPLPLITQTPYSDFYP